MEWIPRDSSCVGTWSTWRADRGPGPTVYYSTRRSNAFFSVLLKGGQPVHRMVLCPDRSRQSADQYESRAVSWTRKFPAPATARK
jgi:hypothetical protein